MDRREIQWTNGRSKAIHFVDKAAGPVYQFFIQNTMITLDTEALFELEELLKIIKEGELYELD